MKPKYRPPLRDEEKQVFKEQRSSNLKLRDEAVKLYDEKILGKDDSISIKTLSGGRPESNRRKF